MILTIIIALLGVIGGLESLAYLDTTVVIEGHYLMILIFFLELVVFASIFIYANYLKKEDKFRTGKEAYIFPKQLYWIFAIGNGIALILFNDYWGENELFLIFVFFYFPVLFFFILRWLLQEVMTLIQLKNEKSKTELMHLQSQVNPHFFFNTLNNLYGWVGKDPEKAQDLILKLSDMMRYSIYDGQKDFVTIEEELVYMQHYIDLHKMRYLKNIEVSFELDIQEKDQEIRPLLFIILLENAFKHGVENLRENAFVHIDISSNEREVYFFIENNFDSTNERGEVGIGLKNLKRRLDLAYPNKHLLEILEKEDVFQASVTLKLI